MGSFVYKKLNFKKFLFLVAIVPAFLSTASPVHAFELNFSGFGSAYYAQSFSEDLSPYGFTNGNTMPDFFDFSSLGIQLKGKLNDSVSFYGQVLALGGQGGLSTIDINNILHSNNFVPFVQFAYVAYQTPLEGFKIKLGRQGYPTLMTAENFRIGYELPYRVKPTYIYNLACFSGFDGITLSQDIGTPVGKLNLAVFGGNPINDINYNYGQTYVVDGMYGVKASLDGEGWKIRAQASAFHNTLTTPQGGYVLNDVQTDTYEAHSRNISIGYQFDKYNIVNWAEYTWIDSPDGSYTNGFSVPGQYFRRYQGGYEMIGYRLGDFLPRYTYSRAGSQDSTFPGDVWSHSIGFNWYGLKDVAFKAEYELDIIPAPQQGLLVVQKKDGTSTRVSSVFAGVDFIF